ncbi:hypothetical protein FHR24_002562 [Wenyingzhuangia heitensis]|uniref:DUF8202 domain-containing protein n=1 Tax=Wenyingzhuangia heitensis TaxID=1487859 RepID=A0ABX0UB90_9FLAO|nr:hypothetical protein [Wenyingzhuangia heitensis]NIJ46084.1 hypothetical protein [Wenyingzhuangia heitensis]
MLSVGLFAQKGPGGVGEINGSSMYLWLKADAGVTQSSGVSQWADQSGNGKDVYAPSSRQRPAYVTSSSAYNNMPIIDFDGYNSNSYYSYYNYGDELNSSTFTDLDDTTHTLFIVWDIETSSPNSESAIYSMSGDLNSGGAFNFDMYGGDIWYYGQGNTSIESHSNYNNPTIFNVIRNSNHTMDVYRNEQSVMSNHSLDSSTAYDLGTQFRIGVNYSGSTSKHLAANVAEVIHFKYTLNLAERIIVSNYLSAKYGISISNDFYNEDDSSNGNFDFDVIGIGRASDGSTHATTEGLSILGLNSPTGLANNEFLIVGHNNTSTNVDEEANIPAEVRNRMKRLWRVSEKGDIITNTVTMDLSFSPNKANFTSSSLKLLVNSDTDFTTGTTVYSAASYNSTTGIAVFNNVSLSDNDYITIGNNDMSPYYFGTSGGGGYVEVTGVEGYEGPGGIGSVDGEAMYMWMRPDAGVTTSGNEITSWTDQSGYLHNGAATYSLNSGVTNPDFGTNQMNNYDVLTFDGNNDEMTFDINDLTDTSYDMYFVWKKNEALQNNASLFSNASGSNAGSFQISHMSDSNFYIRTAEDGNISLGNYSFTESNNILGFSRKASNTLDTYINGGAQQTGTALSSSDVMATFSKLKLGVNRGDGVRLGLNLAEVLMFNNNINTTQRTILRNYLSAKYNIILSANDKYSYDNNSGTFDHHLAGIGQETLTNYHKDSKGTGPVRINNPSNLDNGEYMLWACDQINSSFDFEVVASANYAERLTTKWRVDETGGSVGKVNISFTAEELNITNEVPNTCVNYVLIIDNNADFSSPTQEIPMVLLDGQISAIGVDFADGDYFTLQSANTIVYDGGTWYHPLISRSGTSEPNTSDDCYDLRVLNGSVAIDANVEVNSINVANSAVLAINTARTLTVAKEITLNSSGKLKMLGTAQLVQDPNGLITTNPNTGSGFYSQFTTPAKDVYSFSYISPSTSNGTTYNFKTNVKDGRGDNALSLTNDGKDFVFDAVSSDGSQGASSTTLSQEWFNTFPSDDLGFVNQTPTSNVATGLGFTIKEPGTTAQTYISKGIPNSGKYTFTVAENSVALLGNPYPSAINSDIFLKTNQNVDALYFYEDQTTSPSHFTEDYDGGYAVYTLNGGGVAASVLGLIQNIVSGILKPETNIPVGQGFFVSIEENVNSGSATVEFNNSQRVSSLLGDSSVFFKQSELQTLEKNRDILPSVRLGVEMEVNDQFYHRQVGVSFKEGNSIETFDFGYDAALFDEKGKDAYIESGGKKYILAGVGAISEETEIPIKIVLDEDNEVSFMIDDVEGIDEIYLNDNIEETQESLTGNVIKKTLNSGVYEDRFSLTFKEDKALSNKGLDKNKLTVEINNKLITVTSDEYQITSLNIIDYSGKVAKTANTNTINCANIGSDILILKINTKEGVLIKKIML